MSTVLASYVYHCPKCFTVPNLIIVNENNVPNKICEKCERCGTSAVKSLKDFLSNLERDMRESVNSKINCLEHRCACSFICREEKKYICKNCQKACREKGHKVNSIVDIYIMSSLCEECNDKPNSKYCKECKKNMCENCAEDHKDHETINLIDFFYDTKSINENLLDNNVTIKSYSDLVKKNSSKCKLINDKDVKRASISNADVNNKLLKYFTYVVGHFNVGDTKQFLNYNLINNFRQLKIEYEEYNIEDVPDDQKINTLIDKYEHDFIFKSPNEDYMPNNLGQNAHINTNFTLNEVTSTSYHEDKVNGLLLLSNGRVASYGEDGLIIIYDETSNLNDKVYTINDFKNQSSPVTSACQLKSSELLIAVGNKTMMIFKLADNSYEVKNNVPFGGILTNVISLENNKFAVSLDKGWIYIYDFNDLDKNPININADGNCKIISLYSVNDEKKYFYDNENNEKFSYLIAIDVEYHLKVWDLNGLAANNEELAPLFTLEYIECNGTHAMKFIRNDYNEPLLLIGSNNGINTLELNDEDVCVFAEFDENLNVPKCFMDCKDGYYVTCTDMGEIILMDCDNNDILCKKKECHKGAINCIIKIADGCFATCSDDKTIKLWNYEAEFPQRIDNDYNEDGIPDDEDENEEQLQVPELNPEI